MPASTRVETGVCPPLPATVWITRKCNSMGLGATPPAQL
jgi:hypothetical protein